MKFLAIHSIFMIAALVLADYNTDISNGTCYFAPNRESPSVFIPCGDDGAGHISCCQAGDSCESSKACYNSIFGTTYLTGCTDPTYQDISCPNKGPWNSNVWAGLVQYPLGGSFWVPCNDTYTMITRGFDCGTSLTAASATPTYGFRDARALAFDADLPISTGLSISWQIGYSQSIASTMAANNSSNTDSIPIVTSTLQSTIPVSVVSATPTSSQTTPTDTAHSSASALSSGIKAGIRISAFAGVLLLAFTIWGVAFLVRRKRNRSLSIPTIEEQIRRRSQSYFHNLPSEILPEKGSMSGAGEVLKANPPSWSGPKSELSTKSIQPGVASPTSPVSTRWEFEADRTSGISAPTSPQRYYHNHQGIPTAYGVRELLPNLPRQEAYEMPG